MVFCRQWDYDSDDDALTYTLVQLVASTPPSDSCQPEHDLISHVRNPYNSFWVYSTFCVLMECCSESKLFCPLSITSAN